jgi:7-carboxy-7-deazaguanine synthase
LLISEIFYSLQGEGRYTGRPSVFVRFGGCNLRCEGFGGRCDSFYAVDGEYKESWKKQGAASLIADYKEIAPFLGVDTVITGGEPTLWFRDPDFMEFASFLTASGSQVTVETNGTKKIDFGFEPYRGFVYALSVKLSNSGENKSDRIAKDAINHYLQNSNYFFKFVLDREFVESGRAKAEIDEIKSEFALTRQNIYCMPLGASKEELLLNARSVFEFCAKEGYCYSDRLHIRIYDKKRGV